MHLHFVCIFVTGENILDDGIITNIYMGICAIL